MRLISSGLLGAKSLSNEFGVEPFWRYPLEMMGWYSVGFCVAEILLGIVVCVRATIWSDGFVCAILGFFWSSCIISLQISTWFLMKKGIGGRVVVKRNKQESI